MNCCTTDVIEARFDERYVQKKVKRFQKKGPKKTTAILAGAIANYLEDAMTLLDIGGGIGDLQHLLLAKGIAKTINCEASSAFLEACRQEALARGYADRVLHIQGDFVEVADNVPKADVVTLDRVICCYPDMPELVKKSLDKAGTYYGIVIPSDRWFVKAITSLYYNVRFLFQKNPFRVFVHPVARIEALIDSAGFQRIFVQESMGWLVQLYARKN